MIDKIKEANKLIVDEKRYDDLYPQPYNFWSNFGNKGLDENDHTKMLISFLKYERGHANKYTMPILYSFVKYFGIDVNLNGVAPENIYFSKSYNNLDSKSYPDGLILIKKTFAIVIENKVCDARDQQDQIKRYISIMKEEEHVELENIWVVYLTKDGTLHEGKPTEISYDPDPDANYDIDDRLLCLNYRDDILPWLKEEVVPIIKYSESLFASSVENYVNYMERYVLYTDPISRKIAKLRKNQVLEKLGITDFPTDIELYKSIKKVIQEIDEPKTKGKANKDKVDNEYSPLLSALQDYSDEIINPLLDEFVNVTTRIFKEMGVEVIVKLNTMKKWGCLQIKMKDWADAVHYEWIPFSIDRFINKKIHALFIHVEGKDPKYEELKNKFENYVCKDWNDFEKLYVCKEVGIKKIPKHKVAVMANFEKTIPELIKDNSLYDNLKNVYKKVVIYHDELKGISEEIKVLRSKQFNLTNN